MKLTSVPGYFSNYEELAQIPGQTNYAYTKIVSPGDDGVKRKNWQELLDSLPAGHKVFLVARHGQGYHNLIVDTYGEPEWDRYWSKLNGDGELEWFDAHLTELGIKQVERTGSLIFNGQLDGVVPDVFYCSPLRRCIETFHNSWNQVANLQERGITDHDYDTIELNILEGLRETIGEHTCDKRQPISKTFKEYNLINFDQKNNAKKNSDLRLKLNYLPVYTEEDLLWKADQRETNDEIDKRLSKCLQHIWEREKASGSNNKLISITCHEGVIQSILRVLNHESIPRFETSGVVALVVKEDEEK
ncbi:related to Probable phosphomutase PMU1 [Saccharomycodes ludwigii]|uniref:Related to Probable phosphomutase PMU1 n=1 Tax=Saccharomycodes ludwigii TaxID=36035 RepID=A0A376B5Z1_9ASCO|nr:hypothetical protein SCDLUD_004004 [Saccharomycodes ludwigii]KAH3899718.1 hypothetical protein SCDLUD_004004 [Saccharomycodes ludwigii]SSD60115.1 related to Probable phosphomutase PMU1 [Saccharomycodes ludwigii]